MKGGINFEEWKEIVKKNRRSLRSKSNIFRFEPESLTYGAEKVVKSPEYGQVHTITYNVTGDVDTTSWPTEIKSGKTLTLEITIPYGATSTVSTDLPYTYENGILTIPNIQTSPTITVLVTDALYENAKIGDYLYDDWTFGRTEKPGYLGRCVGLAKDFPDGKSRWGTININSGSIPWSTESVDTQVEKEENVSEKYAYPDDISQRSYCGRSNTQLLLSLGAEKYPAAKWASEQFDGLGYLPNRTELFQCYSNLMTVNSISGSTPLYQHGRVWTSTEESSNYVWAIQYTVTYGYYSSFPTNKRYGKHSDATVPSYPHTVSFMDLSGPCGRPINANGHEYVDLGLPSGTLWATMNVGASSETDYGNHYRYGNGANAYDSINTLYNGTENPLDLSKDTARVVWGGDWRMPTKNEYSELLSNTTYQWVTDYLDSGVNGATFTAQNGNVLFIPAAGDYTNDQINGENTYALLWTSTPAYNTGAWYFYSKNSKKFTKEAMTRIAGYSVRAVIG